MAPRKRLAAPHEVGYISKMAEMRLQIVYAIFVRKVRSGGVLATLNSRIQSLKALNPGTRAVCFFNENSDDLDEFPNIDFVSLGGKTPRLKNLLFPLFLTRWLRDKTHQPTHLILRAHFPAVFYFPAFRKRSFHLVIEHHTVLEPELMILGRLQGAIRVLALKLSRPFADKVTDGKLAVTREILDSESFSGPGCVIANSSSTSHLNPSAVRKFREHDLHIATVLSKDYSWNGLERMFACLEEWKMSNPKLTIHFSVIGSVSAYRCRLPDGITVSYEGFLSPNEIRKTLARAHVAFSTMGLWKQKLSEACPLKSRLYIDLGIPFIAGYVDPDLSGREPFVLGVPNDESVVPWDTVENFLARISEDEEKVRDAFVEARRRISPGNKALELTKFLASIG